MNKLFKAGLAVLAIALLASSASAFSPVWQQIPDIMVGGCEGDGVVFTDAIDAYDFVSDEDNATTSLAIFYSEGPWDENVSRAAQEVDGLLSASVDINGQPEADYAGVGGIPIDLSALVPGGQLTSPASGALTISLPDGDDRAVVLIASDGGTSPTVSKVFRVRGDLLECDEASFPVSVTDVAEWDLQAQFNADWAYAGFGIGSGAVPTSGQTGDALTITSSVANTGLGFWQLSGTAPKIPLANASGGAILRARYTLSGSANPDVWPIAQMRIFANDNQNTAALEVSSAGYVPAANVSREYQLFYEAPSGLTDDLNVAFYVIDVDTALLGGTFRLEKLVVDSIVGLDSLFSTVQIVDAGESLTMNNVTDITISSSITSSKTVDAFTFNAAVISGTNFSFGNALILNLVPSMDANTLYRMTSSVTSTTPQASQPGWGFRLFPDDNNLFSINRVQGTSSSAVLATSTAKPYVSFLTSDGQNGKELRAAFDVIHNDVNRNGNVTWDRAVIEAVDLGLIP